MREGEEAMVRGLQTRRPSPVRRAVLLHERLGWFTMAPGEASLFLGEEAWGAGHIQAQATVRGCIRRNGEGHRRQCCNVCYVCSRERKKAWAWQIWCVRVGEWQSLQRGPRWGIFSGPLNG